MKHDLKPMWQDLWHGRVRIVLVFSTCLAVLLWSHPSALLYDYLYTVLIVIGTISPLVHLIHTLFQSKRHTSDNELLKDGMLQINRIDDRCVIPLAVLTITTIAASLALLHVSAMRATLQNPLPLAPGRWLVAISTSIVITLLLSWPKTVVRSKICGSTRVTRKYYHLE